MPTVMQLERQLALAAGGQVALTVVVWFRMYWVRIREMMERKIKPQQLASRSGSAMQLRDTRASDNLQNCFEMPTLFFALCALGIGAHIVTPGLVRAAWVYVALRAAHSAIHCTYNTVLHRFAVYVASCLWLFAMWGWAVTRFMRERR